MNQYTLRRGTIFGAMALSLTSTLQAASREPVQGIYERSVDGLAFEVRVADDNAPLYYVARAGGMEFSVSATDFSTSYALIPKRGGPNGDSESFHPKDLERLVTGGMVVRLNGANASASVTPIDQLPGARNYLVGDRNHWRRNVARYGGVRYHDVYPGIDLIYRNRDGLFEYEFEIDPGVDPEIIDLQVDGAPIALSEGGELAISTPHGHVTHSAPTAFETSGNVDAAFELRGNGRFGFNVGPRTPGRALRIDPTIYLKIFDRGFYRPIPPRGSIAVDTAGNAYISGHIFDNVQLDAFLAKLDPDGSVVWEVVLGGDGPNELHTAVAVDNAGRVILVGETARLAPPNVNMDLPQCSPNARRGAADVFLVRIEETVPPTVPPTVVMTHGTCISGSHAELPGAVALDAAGNVYITGVTDSKDFMIKDPSPIQPGYRNGPPCDVNAPAEQRVCQDAFVVKVPLNGGNGYVRFIDDPTHWQEGTTDAREWGRGIAVSATGEVWVVGETNSTTNPPPPPGSPPRDLHVSK